MSKWLALILTAMILTACSAAPAGSSQPSGATLPETQPPGDTALPVGNATEASAPNAAGAPMGITVNPPHVPVNPPAGSGSSGWQTYTNSGLGISLDYPADWTVAEQANGVTFTSPQGAIVRLGTSQPAAGSAASLQCNKLINDFNLTINACVDTGTQAYSAEVDTAARKLWLSTTGKDALEVYNQMMQTIQSAK